VTIPVEVEHEITRLLAAARGGDREALDRVFERVYHELERLARSQLRRARGWATLDTRALVHELYLKLSRTGSLTPTDRAHFFALAARAMRQVVLTEAERLRRQKRGGGVRPEPLTDDLAAAPAAWQGEQIVALDSALRELEKESPALARVVELRFFGGLTEAEIGAALDRSERSVRRDWRKARAFLQVELDRLGYPA
jgi:RNA polymerase sigma factor (TIGR02999 family)